MSVGAGHRVVAVAAVAKDRDDLIRQRETARAYTASTPRSGTAGSDAARNQGRRRASPAGRPRRRARTGGDARRTEAVRNRGGPPM